jgi:hypothetical protein
MQPLIDTIKTFVVTIEILSIFLLIVFTFLMTLLWLDNRRKNKVIKGINESLAKWQEGQNDGISYLEVMPASPGERYHNE